MQSPFEGKQPIGVVYNTSMDRPDAALTLALLYGFQGKRESRMASISINGAGLGAAIFCVFGMLAMNGLPAPYHPVFNVPRFALATRDRFFLLIKARDRKFDLAATKEFLASLHAREVSEVDA